MTTQPIRRSQFITTYGPGAILEGPDGPVVMRTLDLSGVFRDLRETDFEVTDQRLSDALLDGSGILRLPTNAEVGEAENRWIYRTNRFPSWSLCVRGHAVLYSKRNDDNRACPLCNSYAGPREAWRQATRDAVRFVRACPSGHLDDVNWRGMIPHANTPCNPQYLRWVGGGGALRHVNIVCPDCGESINLGRAYASKWPCSGRFPGARETEDSMWSNFQNHPTRGRQSPYG